MLKLSTVTIALVIAAGGTMDDCAMGQSPPLEDVLTAFERGCDLIESFDVDVKADTRYYIDSIYENSKLVELRNFPTPASRTTITHQRFLSGDYRMDLEKLSDQEKEAGDVITVWKGGVERYLSRKQNFGRIRPYGQTRSAPLATNYLCLYQSFDGNYMSYAGFVRSRLPENVSVSPQGELLVVEALPEPSRRVHNNKTGIRLFLDPSKNFLPARISFLLRQPGEDVRTWEDWKIDIKEVQPGIWAPIRCTVEGLVVQGDPIHRPFLGQKIQDHVIAIDEITAVFNGDINADVFDLKFPRGTKVSDEVRKIVYTVGADNPSEHLAELARQGKLGADELAKNPPRVVTAQLLERSNWRWIMWAFSIVCLLVMVTWGTWTLRRRARLT